MTADDLMLIFKNADDDTAMLPLSRLHQIDGGTGSIVLTFGGSQLMTILLMQILTLLH